MEVYEYLKEKTLGKFDNGEQVKVTAEELIRELDLNQQTIYSNLRRLRLTEGVKHEVYQVRRHKEGRQIVFNQNFWWIVGSVELEEQNERTTKTN